MFCLDPNPEIKQKTPQTRTPHQDYSSLDLQFEICSNFLKATSHQLYHKELEIIQSSFKLIEKLNDSLNAQKDVSSTQESMTFDPSADDEDPFTQTTKSKLLLRKSKSNSNLRRTDSGITEALRQAQNKCSERTSSVLSNLVVEYRRIKEKVAATEKMEKEIKRAESGYASAQQELLLLRKKVSDLQKQSIQQTQEMQMLKSKLKHQQEQFPTQTLALSRSTDQLRPLVMTNQQKLKRYLSQKQNQLNRKERQLKVIQDNIELSLIGGIADSCEKCCSMMKKIKQSFMKYRNFLEEEAKASQALYDKCKSLFS